jgi:hypothetical protein
MNKLELMVKAKCTKDFAYPRIIDMSNCWFSYRSKGKDLSDFRNKEERIV